MARTRRRAAETQRLEPGHTYFDLDHPERGAFTATGDEQIPADANIVDQTDVDEDAWERLLAGGWGAFQVGAGDRAYTPGAFGQENNPRSDVMNAAPPGVGEGLSPRDTEEERPRR